MPNFKIYSSTCSNDNNRFDSLFEYDYIIVGAGITGAMCAEQLNEKYKGIKNILVLERHNEIGGCLKSYTRSYGDTAYTNSEYRRPFEFGGMRYFKDTMPNIDKYVEKYGLTCITTQTSGNNNLLLTDDQVTSINNSDEWTQKINKFEQAIENIISTEIKTPFIEFISSYKHRKEWYSDILNSRLTSRSKLVNKHISNTVWYNYSRHTGYEGFIDSDICALTGLLEAYDVGGAQQCAIKEGFQTLVQKIFEQQNVEIKFNTNVLKFEKNVLHTDNGFYKAKSVIWTIPPKFMHDICCVSNVSHNIIDELKHGFWDFRATKIFLMYDEPWWNSDFIGRNLADNAMGQLWVWDDKTLCIYCCDEKANYWMTILDIDPAQSYGKYIDIKENIDETPSWYTNYVVPNISEMFDTTNITKLTGYAVAAWNNNVTMWGARSSLYKSVIDRRQLIRNISDNHIYTNNGSSLRSGWVDGSIEEVLNLFTEVDI